MAKAKFERAEVVASATDLFWRQGYNSASMQDVFSVTGLQPGSLYNAFGNKEGLYEEALRYYGNNSLTRLEKSFAEHSDELEAFCFILLSMVNDAMSDSFRSCFLVKSQLELNSMGNERLSGVVCEQLQTIQDMFARQLRKHFDEDLAQQRAVSVLMAISGLRVIGFMKQTREDMTQSLVNGFAWLPWDKALAKVKAQATAEPVSAD